MMEVRKAALAKEMLNYMSSEIAISSSYRAAEYVPTKHTYHQTLSNAFGTSGRTENDNTIKVVTSITIKYYFSPSKRQ